MRFKVYGRVRCMRMLATATVAVALLACAPSMVAQTGDEAVAKAADAYRRQDRAQLASLRAILEGEGHPLTMWVDYWELANRLATATPQDVAAFYSRWPGTYVEDRLRNDWLLELGRRRDWSSFANEYPRFRMKDDREVACYSLLIDYSAGRVVRGSARTAWLAQRDVDEGCALLATTLYEAQVLSEADVWRKARIGIDAGRTPLVQQAVVLVNPQAGHDVNDLTESPLRYLARKGAYANRRAQEMSLLALMRAASLDPTATSTLLSRKWEDVLPVELAALAWATVGKQATLKVLPEAYGYFERAFELAAKEKIEMAWLDDIMVWRVRAALRSGSGLTRWRQILHSIDAMNAIEQRDPAWVYWKARALSALAPGALQPEVLISGAQELLRSIAGGYHFYGSLAAEELGLPIRIQPRPQPLLPEEKGVIHSEAALARAIQLIGLGLRSEGVREWNFALRGMKERELLAAAQVACDREIWDRCINTSERTQFEVDMAQRFPTPYRKEMTRRSREVGLELAFVYGLIRQESRFVQDARSGVGASGLMQIMPATARWTAKKIGAHYSQSMINDRGVNLQLGTSYLKFLLDDFSGSQALAAAAYNAGPNRSRRWREGILLEPAAWIETIPFSETRDYVKRVLSNASFYAALLEDPAATQASSLKARMGALIGPRASDAPPLNMELP